MPYPVSSNYSSKFVIVNTGFEKAFTIIQRSLDQRALSSSYHFDHSTTTLSLSKINAQRTMATKEQGGGAEGIKALSGQSNKEMDDLFNNAMYWIEVRHNLQDHPALRAAAQAPPPEETSTFAKNCNVCDEILHELTKCKTVRPRHALLSYAIRSRVDRLAAQKKVPRDIRVTIQTNERRAAHRQTIIRTCAAYVRYIKQHGKATGPVNWPAGVHHVSDSGLECSVCTKLLKELRICGTMQSLDDLVSQMQRDPEAQQHIGTAPGEYQMAKYLQSLRCINMNPARLACTGMSTRRLDSSVGTLTQKVLY